MSDGSAAPELDADTSTRYHHLVEHLQDAVVEFELVDGVPVVRKVNAAFGDIFGYDPDAIRGESLNEWIVPDWQGEEARRLDDRTADGEINYRRVTRETTNGLREFLYRGIPMDDDDIRTDGFAVYTDLTEMTRHERRLKVLNRVLRHNLRNKVNVIAASTSRLLDALDDRSIECVETAARVEGAAHDLETLTREARNIKTVMDSEVDDPAIDCVPLIQRIVAEYRRRVPSVTIEMQSPDSMAVKANGHLRFAIESLIDNAIEHNPADEPTVRVRVTAARAEGWANIYVDDDGPRIPADERAVLTGDAEITPTRHGSGLGLWIVKWTTELFGGDLSFATSDLGGNSVRLRLPRRESAET
jgi:PAS domain S-box-containing protein